MAPKWLDHWTTRAGFNFPLILKTIIIAQMMSTEEEGVLKLKVNKKPSYR